MFATTEIPVGDYISPNFQKIMPDRCFPNLIVGDPSTQPWKYLRREISHNWYVDQRQPYVGFLSRDEAHILYNTALQFAGKPALEIGCWLGWSACHLALAGVNLDVIDPMLNQDDFFGSVARSLIMAGVMPRVNLVPGFSPAEVEGLIVKNNQLWSLIFIDGNHEAPGPLEDAITCAKYAAPDALILFHDLAAPDVSQGLDYLKSQGWQTMVYQTMQIMGVAWRGNVQPIQHIPDPSINWHIPVHLQHYEVSGIDNFDVQEFTEILNQVRPFTLLSEMRLYALYAATKQICRQDIPGNFVECGAFKGGASAMMAFVIKHYSQRPRKLFAFDTFAGMPEPTEVDRHGGIAANDTDFGVGTLSAPIAENIHRIAELLNVRDIIEAVPGLFADTLPVYRSQIGEIALLHADGDWYESTMDIFNHLYDAVVLKGIIQVDDYGHWEGCRIAIHEFERVRNLKFELEQIDYTGVRFTKTLLTNLANQDDSSWSTVTSPPLRLHSAIIFFDWAKSFEAIYNTLREIIKEIFLSSHPESISLCLYAKSEYVDKADELLSEIIMELLMQTDISLDQEPQVIIISNTEDSVWQDLLKSGLRLILVEETDQDAIANLPIKLSTCSLADII